MQAVIGHLQISALAPGLGLKGKHAEDLGVDFGVDIAGPNLLFSGVTIASLLCTIFT